MLDEQFVCRLKQFFNFFVELINKLSFLDEEEQDLANSSTNPFGDPDTAELNPFGDPDVEGNRFVLHNSSLIANA